jgi:hypothetical protein
VERDLAMWGERVADSQVAWPTSHPCRISDKVQFRRLVIPNRETPHRILRHFQVMRFTVRLQEG